MRYLLLLLFIVPFNIGAVTGEDVRFDWELGQPTVTVDPTSACTDTAVARFDWVLGEPSVVFDATANCTAAAADEDEIIKQNVFWFD